jgi:hypothetical protein
MIAEIRQQLLFQLRTNVVEQLAEFPPLLFLLLRASVMNSGFPIFLVQFCLVQIALG